MRHWEKAFMLVIAGCLTLQTGCSREVQEEPITLTYWSDIRTRVGAYRTDIPLYTELEKRLGVHLEIIDIDAAETSQQFSIMLSSGSYPDIIEYNLSGYPGGARKAITDEVILPLNDLMAEHAPNLLAQLAAHPAWDREVRTEDGLYYTFPMIRNNPKLCTYIGPALRKDWLEKLQLEVPKSITEWENVLLKFKEIPGVEYPFAYEESVMKASSAFMSAYGAKGVQEAFYYEDGKVHFSPAEAGYQQFWTLWNRWYSMGLLAPDFATSSHEVITEKIGAGKVGATICRAGGGIGTYLQKAKEKSFDFVAAPYPTLDGQSRVKFSHNMPECAPFASVSTHCKNPEKAVEVLDYGYGEDGVLLYNFGIENESFVFENGKPIYTDMVRQNPEGKSMSEILNLYVRSTHSGPFIQNIGYMEQYMYRPQQQEALDVWTSNTDGTKYKMPQYTLTSEEQSRYNEIMIPVFQYIRTQELQFVLGKRPLSEFQEYVAELYSMGLGDAVKIVEQAVRRAEGM